MPDSTPRASGAWRCGSGNRSQAFNALRSLPDEIRGGPNGHRLRSSLRIRAPSHKASHQLSESTSGHRAHDLLRRRRPLRRVPVGLGTDHSSNTLLRPCQARSREEGERPSKRSGTARTSRASPALVMSHIAFGRGRGGAAVPLRLGTRFGHRCPWDVRLATWERMPGSGSISDLLPAQDPFPFDLAQACENVGPTTPDDERDLPGCEPGSALDQGDDLVAEAHSPSPSR